MFGEKGNKTMKIGFLGVGGTGKSTTLNLLEELNLPRLGSVSRSIFQKHGVTESSLIEQPVDVCLRIQREIFEAKLKSDFDFKYGLSERTLLDTYCYMLMWCHRGMSDHLVKSLEIVTEENLKQYSMLFLFSTKYHFKPADGFRASGLAQSYIIEALLVGNLRKFGFPYLEVPAGCPDERANFVEFEIKRVQHNANTKEY